MNTPAAVDVRQTEATPRSVPSRGRGTRPWRTREYRDEDLMVVSALWRDVHLVTHKSAVRRRASSPSALLTTASRFDRVRFFRRRARPNRTCPGASNLFRSILRRATLQDLPESLARSDFVPEGLNDRSQAIYCLEPVQTGIRPIGTV